MLLAGRCSLFAVVVCCLLYVCLFIHVFVVHCSLLVVSSLVWCLLFVRVCSSCVGVGRCALFVVLLIAAW